MKRILLLLLAAAGGPAWSQTNLPAPKAPEPQVEISSDSGRFDGNTRRMIYSGHVLATDAKSKLRCEQLTVDLPAEGGHPTNIVAETGVVIDRVDEKGQTNHITADKAVYSYSVVKGVTNEVATFTGGNPTPKVENQQLIIVGEPLVMNLVTKQFSGQNYKTTFKQTPNAGGDTNATPLNFLK
jgi:lipopolysaccharide export system protein LptA